MPRRKRTQFWGRDRDDDRLLSQVLEGRKTATACPAVEYHVPYGNFDDGGYVTGDIVEVYDLRENLRCLILITEVYEVPMGDIPEKLWRGECNASADEFRRDHISCWPEHDVTDDFRITINHFELVAERPSIHTPRLRGEPVEKRHAPAMVSVLSDPAIFRFLSDDPPSLAHLDRHYEYLSRGKSPDGREHWLTWILFAREAGSAPLGFIQATVREPETVHVGYVLNPTHWRQGYAREAITALLHTVFEHYPVERAIAEMDTRNLASKCLVESLGFRRVDTVVADEYVYEVTRSDWERRGG